MTYPVEQLIVLQSDDWIVVNKPAGSSIHGNEQSVGFVAELKNTLQLEFLAPVHRLDQVTSGCLLLAKSSSAASYLSRQFQLRQVNKYYLAITQGKPKRKQGRIVGDMVPLRNGNWKLTQGKENPAITRFFSYGFVEGARIVVANILTGKSHQIRVAMKSNGSAILGDHRYGSHATLQPSDRCYLHSWQLHFSDKNGQRIIAQCVPQTGHWFLIKEFRDFISDERLIERFNQNA